MRVDRDDGFSVLASKAARWVADHLEELRQADPDVPRALNDRQAEIGAACSRSRIWLVVIGQSRHALQRWL